MERFVNIFGARKDVENKVDISLTLEAQSHLKQLVTRPNPNLAEFAFLGLGKNGVVDQILIDDHISLSDKSGLTKSGDHGAESKVSHQELIQLFTKLYYLKREQDFLILGHSHPMGVAEIEGRYYWIEPSNALLEPSMGSNKEGGPTSNHDLGFLKEFFEKIVNFPYAGITTITNHGPKLRIYKTAELIKIKRYTDLDRVPQITINL